METKMSSGREIPTQYKQIEEKRKQHPTAQRNKRIILETLGRAQWLIQSSINSSSSRVSSAMQQKNKTKCYLLRFKLF
jgi:hypothetical protein